MNAKTERIRVSLTEDEYNALAKLAEAELRSVDEQLRALLRRAARRRGLLPTTPGAGARS